MGWVDQLPSRTSLNRYGLFISDVHKILKNREMCKVACKTTDKAAIIAALASNHSWKTFSYFRDGKDFDRNAIIEETRHAFDKGWMNITERDVEEVMELDISEYSLSMWLFYAMPKDDRQKYKELFGELKKELAMGLEPIERIAD
jgi:hypothetical protein